MVSDTISKDRPRPFRFRMPERSMAASLPALDLDKQDQGRHSGMSTDKRPLKPDGLPAPRPLSWFCCQSHGEGLTIVITYKN